MKIKMCFFSVPKKSSIFIYFYLFEQIDFNFRYNFWSLRPPSVKIFGVGRWEIRDPEGKGIPAISIQ